MQVDRVIELVGPLSNTDRRLDRRHWRIDLLDTPWKLDPSFRWLLPDWDLRHPNERSERKVALSRLVLSEEGASVRLVLQVTEWREVRAIQEHLERVEGEHRRAHVLARLGLQGEYEVPNILAVHCVVATEDDQLLLVQRSAITPYFPLSWSVSLEEGLALTDVCSDGEEALGQATRRGLIEELNLRVNAITSVRLLGICAEFPTLNPCVVTYASVAATVDDIRLSQLGARDREEGLAISSVALDSDSLMALVRTIAPSFRTSGDRYLAMIGRAGLVTRG